MIQRYNMNKYFKDIKIHIVEAECQVGDATAFGYVLRPVKIEEKKKKITGDGGSLSLR